MTGAETLKIERRGRVAILSFNRPRVLNAFDGPLVKATTQAMAELSADENVLAIVVRGEGRAFSAGFDLKAGAATAGQRSLADWRRVLETDFAFIMTFWECPKPTIAAIHGYCIGGAFELSLACDITVAAAGTRLGAPEVKFGSGAVAMLLPFVTGREGGEGNIAHRRRPPQRRKSARRSASSIMSRRLGEELAKALAIAESIAAADPMAVQLSKRALNRSYEAMGMRAALAQALEADIFIEGAGGPKRAEFDRIRREQGLKAALAWRDGSG